MRRTAVRVALASTLVCALAITAEGVARQGVESGVRLSLTYLSDTDQRFYGAGISATKKRCVPDRKVSFFEKLPGDDRLIGKERSDEAGEAVVEESPAPPFGDGVFYAKVKR